MVQEITTNSWGNRIIGALWGILIGLALIIGAFYLVFWNEGNSLHTAQSLAQTESVLVTVVNSPVDPKNDLRVVYLSGLATTNDILHDKLFNVSEKAIQLNRQVEMYQWNQNEETKTEKQIGGSEQEVKTYTYSRTWSSDLIDSSNFKEQEAHQNPSIMPIESQIHYAKKVNVGDFILPADLIKKISGDSKIDLSNVDTTILKGKFKKPVQQSGDGLYLGDDPTMPKIGDMRITITSVLPETISVIAQQAGTSLQPYMAPAGQAISLIEMGQISPQEMIHNAESENRVMAWLLRLASLVMMMIGFGLIMKPVSVLADVIPFFGNLVGFGTGLIAFICGLGLWTIAIAIAWFTVRPLWAAGIIVVVAGICYLLYARKKRINLNKQS